MKSTQECSSLSAFFPAYNDAPGLPSLVGATFALLEGWVEDFEVIVVNDGSHDDTAEVLERLQARYGERLRVVTHERNRGYGAALRSGFAAARKELVFYTDGDGQYDIRELPLLAARLGPRTGFVNGYKLERHDPLHRVWIGKIYNSLARLLFGVEVRDIDCDYRLIRRQLVDAISLESTSGTVCVELVRKLETTGWEFEEVGVHHYPRLYGRSQFFRLRSLLVTLYQLVRLYATVVVKPALARKVHRTA
ncbi:MAG: glycosyltransferase family 2 protein [Bryobacteraceae bacterium]